MELYDKVIREAYDAIRGSGCMCRVKACDVRPWPELPENTFIMQKDAGLELGGGGEPSVNFTCMTTSGLVTEDEIVIAGKDIREIVGGCAFARIVILETKDLGETVDTEEAFHAVRYLSFVRYHVFPEGYMVRVSSQSDQEQVRISSRALKNGIDFGRVGRTYIDKYLSEEKVKHVRVIFVTNRALVEKLLPMADKVDKITRALTHILDGMPKDCGHCSMKPVCDEVEGMRELHLR